MAVSLPGLPDNLRSLSARLTIDTHIQRDLSVIIDEAVQCAGTFSKSFKENAEQLHIQNELVKQASKPKDVQLEDLQKVLVNTRTGFTSSRMDILELQTKVHAQIENCRGQVKKHREEQATKKGEIDTKKEEILKNKETIDQNERDVEDLDKAARQLIEHADELEKMAQKKKKRGKLRKITAGAIGIVFAPVTGGASLLAGTAAGAIIHGVNEKDVNDCKNRARSCLESAEGKKNSASQLRDDVKRLEGTIDALETEIAQLDKRIGALEEAVKALEDVMALLRSSVSITDEVINAIQEMESSLLDPLLKSQSFCVARNSEKEEIANKQLDKLKESLGHLNDIINRHRRSALNN